MRAAQIAHYGDPDVIVVNDVERPEPGAGEVLVRVDASSVNGHDTAVRAGKLKIMTGRRFPIGVGLDFAGSVVACGEGVLGHPVGQRVWGMVALRGRHVTAAAAEYVVVPASRVAPAPAALRATDAASLVVTGSTALIALTAIARLAAGETVLVRGAAGGVGAATVQLARTLGGRVTALARARDTALVTDLGAERVVDYRTTEVGRLDRFDVIVDTVGSGLSAYRRRLTPGGRMVTVAFGSAAAVAAIARSTVHGPRRIRTFGADPDTAVLEALTAHVDAGSLHAVVDTVRPLADIATAHRAFAEGGHPGKQVLTLAD